MESFEICSHPLVSGPVSQWPSSTWVGCRLSEAILHAHAPSRYDGLRGSTNVPQKAC